MRPSLPTCQPDASANAKLSRDIRLTVVACLIGTLERFRFRVVWLVSSNARLRMSMGSCLAEWIVRIMRKCIRPVLVLEVQVYSCSIFELRGLC